MTQHNRYDSGAAFVAPNPSIAPPEPIRKEDVLNQISGIVDIYREQSNAALVRVQDDVSQGGYISNAAQVAERRRTSRMYLLAYVFIAAAVTGGLSLMAWVGGASNVIALSAWLVGTGALSGWFIWRRHGDEFRNSPEGIANHVIEAHWDLGLYQAETQRHAIELEYDAAKRRDDLRRMELSQNLAIAESRVRGVEQRRRMAEAQRQEWMPPAPEPEPVPAQVDADEHDTDWRHALAVWIAQLYVDGCNADGRIAGRVPWSQRSDWPAEAKAEAKRICVDGRPALIQQISGGHWRLRIDMFPDADIALRLIRSRFEAD